jgi:hydrogenase maturation protease
MLIIGIGNILEKDDGVGVYASTYLQKNFKFFPEVEIINGGVEGIHLLNRLEEHKEILLLDAIEIEDNPSSIYLIPAKELGDRGLNVGGAHEIGVLESLSILELQGKPIPDVTLLGIVPEDVSFEIDLSDTLKRGFDRYIGVALEFLKDKGIKVTKNSNITSLNDIIDSFKLLKK